MLNLDEAAQKVLDSLRQEWVQTAEIVKLDTCVFVLRVYPEREKDINQQNKSASGRGLYAYFVWAYMFFVFLIPCSMMQSETRHETLYLHFELLVMKLKARMTKTKTAQIFYNTSSTLLLEKRVAGFYHHFPYFP